jgi:uncharacterized protein (TIGR02453 family)
MIKKHTFDFLVALKQNNNRDWFQANNTWYQQAKADFEQFVSELISEIGKFDPPVSLLKPRDCIFRIFRDVRFAKDKSPYKTNFGAYIVPGGKKFGLAGYYFHIEPGECFLAGGIWHPSSDVLKKLRKEIYENIDEFLLILNDKEFSKHFDKIYGEKLVNPPSGFPSDFPHIDILKFKDYNVVKDLSCQDLFTKNIIEETVRMCKIMYPFNRFLNYSLTGYVR